MRKFNFHEALKHYTWEEIEAHPEIKKMLEAYGKSKELDKPSPKVELVTPKKPTEKPHVPAVTDAEKFNVFKMMFDHIAEVKSEHAKTQESNTKLHADMVKAHTDSKAEMQAIIDKQAKLIDELTAKLGKVEKDHNITKQIVDSHAKHRDNIEDKIMDSVNQCLVEIKKVALNNANESKKLWDNMDALTLDIENLNMDGMKMAIVRRGNLIDYIEAGRMRFNILRGADDKADYIEIEERGGHA